MIGSCEPCSEEDLVRGSSALLAYNRNAVSIKGSIRQGGPVKSQTPSVMLIQPTRATTPVSRYTRMRVALEKCETRRISIQGARLRGNVRKDNNNSQPFPEVVSNLSS